MIVLTESRRRTLWDAIDDARMAGDRLEVVDQLEETLADTRDGDLLDFEDFDVAEFVADELRFEFADVVAL